MGTRADFYAGLGESAEWLGSIAWDGYPSGVFDDAAELFAGPPVTEAEWRKWVAEFLDAREDATYPADGWPWPWDDSATTDYAYVLRDGAVLASGFGTPWFAVDPEAECYGEPDETDASAERPTFPNMGEQRNMPAGKRSGVIIVGFDGHGNATVA